MKAICGEFDSSSEAGEKQAKFETILQLMQQVSVCCCSDSRITEHVFSVAAVRTATGRVGWTDGE